MIIKKENPLNPVLIAISFFAVILTLTLIFGRNFLFIENESLGLQGETQKTNSLDVKIPVNLKNQDRGVGSLESTPLQLSKKIDKLESKVARIKANQHLRVQSDLDANFDGDNEGSLMDEEAQAAVQLQEQVALMNNTLQSEYLDDQWSEAAVADVYESFQKDSGDGYAVLDADCRSTMCRVIVMLGDASPEENFMELGEKLPWNGEIFFQVDDMESGEAVIYLAREDHSLPRVN